MIERGTIQEHTTLLGYRLRKPGNDRRTPVVSKLAQPPLQACTINQSGLEIVGAGQTLCTTITLDQGLGMEGAARALSTTITLAKELGAGGAGQVFLAFAQSAEIHSPFALKWFNNGIPDHEAHMMWLADGHPHIVNYLGQGPGLLCMEYLEGENALQRLSSSSNGLDQETVIKVAKAIASALQHLHELGLVHRDVKPENIFICKNGNIKLFDLGTATSYEDSSSDDGSTTGTPGYMSPEQVYAKQLDGRSDIFSLGVTLLELITKKDPFWHPLPLTAMVNCITNEIPAELYARVPEKLQPILKKMLEKNPLNRYANCAELIDDLNKL